MSNIRSFRNEDIDRVMEIWLESSIKAHDFIHRDYWIKNYDVVKNQYIPISESYVYEDDNEIKGFISIIEGNFIGALFIANNSQNKGIGKALINVVKEKYHSISLAVYKDNEKALNFYLSQGFKVVNEEINEDSNKPELVMDYKKEIGSEYF